MGSNSESLDEQVERAKDEGMVAQPGHGEDPAEGRRLLVATGATVADVDELPEFVRILLHEAALVLVITPVLASRLEWLVSDTDRARHQADERLNTVMGQMAEIGVDAVGVVADESPVTAFEDAVCTFGPDHILIALREHESAGWQERGLIDTVRERFKVPLTVFEIDTGGHVPEHGST